MRYSRALVVANPIAGRGRGVMIGQLVVDGLAARGVAAELVLTQARGDGAARVRRLGAAIDLVIAVGGDGTLREVLDGLPDPAIPVGLVPVGTANVMSRELGLPRDPRKALDVILAGHVKALDVGRVNGRLCGFVTGIGLDAMVVRDVERRRRGPITRWNYVWALLRVLPKYTPPRLTVVIPGEEPVAAGFVLVSNCSRYAGLFRLTSRRQPDDGAFDIYLFRNASRRALAVAAIRGVAGQIAGAGGCERRSARQVRVTADEPVPFQVDGDDGGDTPVEFVAETRRYHILVP